MRNIFGLFSELGKYQVSALCFKMYQKFAEFDFQITFCIDLKIFVID